MITNVLNRSNKRQIILNIKPQKYKFFMDLLNNFYFVEIIETETEGDSRKEIITNLKQTAKDLQLLKEGKLKTRSARELLNEI